MADAIVHDHGDTGDQYTLRLDAPGTYAYFCTLRPWMTGRIVVG